MTHVGCLLPLGKECPHCKDGRLDRPGMEQVKANLTGKPARPGTLPVRGACRHLGQPTGETVACDSCPKAKTRLKVHACDRHGQCVLGPQQSPGVACCTTCPDHTGRAVQITVTADGIGDAILGLTSVCGLKKDAPDREVVYHVKPWQVGWVNLFDGPDYVTTAPADNLRTVKPHDTYKVQNAERLRIPRWEYYAGVCNTAAVLPTPRRLPDATLEWAEQYRGAIVLAPWSGWRNPRGEDWMPNPRVWLTSHWLALEQLLLKQGKRALILDNVADRNSEFQSDKLINEPPSRVAAVLRVAACVVGNDSGMVHLAGALGVKALVLCAQIKGERVYGIYPTVEALDAPWSCGGCHWQGAHGWHPVCDKMCANLQAIQPSDVLARIDKLTAPPPPAWADAPTAKFLTLTGIGDVVWALTKMRSIAGNRPIEVTISGNVKEEVESRTIPFLKRFPWISKVNLELVPVLENYSKPADERGQYRYLPDGERDGRYYLMPNGALEKGVRLEDWMPEAPINWSVMDGFDWSGTDAAVAIAKVYAPFVALYLGPEKGNTQEGHNRGGLWSPKDWLALGAEVQRRGMNVAVVGAPYDRSYWENHVRPLVEAAGMRWLDMIGRWEIGSTLAFLRRAQFFASYQCGLGIVSHYLGQRVAMWWRQEGNTIHPHFYLSFDERMAHCWTQPNSEGRYLPLYYGRQSASEVIELIEERGWLQ